jgi:hypothetical protein
METDESTITRESEAWKAAGAASLGRTRAVRSVANAARTAKQIHHIATDKSIKSGYTEAFERIFKKAGMTLDDAANKVDLPGHAGRHSPKYHEYVLSRLRGATEGLSGTDAATALRAQLGTLRQELLANPDMVRGIGLP